MTDRVGSFSFIRTTPLGTLRDLGVRRAASVLWKAARGDKPGVKRMFEKHFARMDARAAVGAARVSQHFSRDFVGLRALLQATRDQGADRRGNDKTDIAYRTTLFTVAWDLTIAKNKPILWDWNVRHASDGQDHRTLKANLRAAFGEGKEETVDRDLEAMVRYGCLPQYEVGPGAMERPPERAGIEHDLEIVDRLPPGVSACQGSNARRWNQDTGEFQAVPNILYKASFAIRHDGNAVALALSNSGVDDCSAANKALLSGGPTPGETSGCLVRRRDDGQFDITGVREGERLWAVVPPNETGEKGGVAVLGMDPGGIHVPSNTLIVALSDAAGRALAMVPEREQQTALAPKTLTEIAGSADPAATLHELMSELIKRGTHLDIKAREAAHATAEHLAVFKLAHRSPKILQHDGMVDRINKMLDVAGIPPDARNEYRVSMDQSEDEFVAAVGRILENLDELKKGIETSVGGDLAIVVMSPRQLLGRDAKEAPSSPPPAARPDRPLTRDSLDDFLFDEEDPLRSTPTLKFREPGDDV
jgi:hypothetical protein